MHRASEEYKAWLKSIQAGDTVIIEGSGWARSTRACKVIRVTKTQIVIDENDRFRIIDGMRVGGSHSSFSRCHLMKPTQELMEKIEHERLSDWLGIIARQNSDTRQKLSLAQLKAMKKAHDDNAPKQENAAK